MTLMARWSTCCLCINIQGYYSCNAWVWHLLGHRGRLLGYWSVFMYFHILTGELQATAVSISLRIRCHSYSSSVVRKLSERSSILKLLYNLLLPMSWRRVIRGTGADMEGLPELQPEVMRKEYKTACDAIEPIREGGGPCSSLVDVCCGRSVWKSSRYFCARIKACCFQTGYSVLKFCRGKIAVFTYHVRDVCRSALQHHVFVCVGLKLLSSVISQKFCLCNCFVIVQS
jgi:hypothetical protein